MSSSINTRQTLILTRRQLLSSPSSLEMYSNHSRVCFGNKNSTCLSIMFLKLDHNSPGISKSIVRSKTDARVKQPSQCRTSGCKKGDNERPEAQNKRKERPKTKTNRNATSKTNKETGRGLSIPKRSHSMLCLCRRICTGQREMRADTIAYA